MLTIAHDKLPQTSLTYLAFRLAFRETLERIALADQVGSDPHEPFGFLTEVPFLRAVPAHVQLDLLAATWAKHVSRDAVEATLLDEAVLFAACETAAALIESEPDVVEEFLHGGPMGLSQPIDEQLATSIRELPSSIASEGDFLLISQFEDMAPHHAQTVKEAYGLSDERTEPLFDVLSRWYLTPEFLGNLTGMLTSREVIKSVHVLGVR